MVSIADARGDVDGIVVTGFRRRVRIVAPANGSLDFEGGRDGDGGWVAGGVCGRRLFAASQSSSAN